MNRAGHLSTQKKRLTHCTPDPLLGLREGLALPRPLVGSDFYYQLMSGEVLFLMYCLI